MYKTMSAFPPPALTHQNDSQPLYAEAGWNVYGSSTNRTIAPNTAYVQQWDTVIVAQDNLQYISNNATTGLVTFLEDGYYAISGSVQLQPVAATNNTEALVRILLDTDSALIPGSPLYIANTSVKSIAAQTANYSTQYMMGCVSASGFFHNGDSIGIYITNLDATVGHTLSSLSGFASLWITKLS